MTDTTQALPTQMEPVVDHKRRWSTSWWRFMKPLLDTVRNTSERVTTVSGEVDGISSSVSVLQSVVDAFKPKWSVKINTNGRVTGAVQLEGLGDTSTFAVMADKFIIVLPSNNAVEIQAFIAGLVAGVPTVGINGSLIVDGTILARHIQAVSLAAINANLGTVTAGRVQSASGKSFWDLNTDEFVIGAP